MGEVKEETDDLAQPDSLKYLIESVYFHWIVEHVKFREVIPKMKTFIDRDIAHQVFALEGGGRDKEAGMIFMEALRTLISEPGRYRTFLQSLEDLGYTHIVKAINEGRVNEHHEEHKKILDLFADPLSEKIDPTVMAYKLLEKDIISRQDVEEITKTEINSLTYTAAFKLLDILPRKKENWYEIFLELLYDQGHHKLCEAIDPKYFGQRQGANQSDGNEEDFFVLSDEIEGKSEIIPSAPADYGFKDVSSGAKPKTYAQEDVPSLPQCKCNCSCVKTFDEKFEELKAILLTRLGNLERKIETITSVQLKTDG